MPSSVGRAALTELDRVPWESLAHAYGTGKLGPDLHEDVAGTLRRLGDAGAFDEAMEALFSNVCHQGTIYEATAYAVPFLAAFAAGTDLSPAEVPFFVALLGNIGVAASFEAPHGSHAGSWGRDVGPFTRAAIRASGGHLSAMARRTPKLKELEEALAALVRTDSPDPAAVARLEELVEELEAG